MSDICKLQLLKVIKEYFDQKGFLIHSKDCEDIAAHIQKLEAEKVALEERLLDFEKIQPDILSLAKSMQFKMDKNKNKPHSLMNPNGDNRSYHHLSLATLFDLMCGEVQELKEALMEDYYLADLPWSVKYECADVANFAMMIHENISKRYDDKELLKAQEV